MAYSAPFQRLVLMGTLYDDTFNTTLSIIRRPGSGTLDLPSPADMLAPIAAALSDYWSIFPSGGGPGIHSEAILTGFKLNTIGVDGHYAAAETFEYTFPAPLPGGGQDGSFPAQLATVVTLATAVPRGRASKGRMFLPVCDGFGQVGTDGRAAAADALGVATATAALISDINAAYLAQQSGDEYLGRVGVVSNIGAGTSREVTAIRCGRVTDTIRSRRNRITEQPEEAPLP